VLCPAGAFHVAEDSAAALREELIDSLLAGAPRHSRDDVISAAAILRSLNRVEVAADTEVESRSRCAQPTARRIWHAEQNVWSLFGSH
jgi:hypothetical protein